MIATYACALALGPASALRLKPGDGLRVVVSSSTASASLLSPFEGVYVVADDGAIYGTGFGRLLVAGKPFAEVERGIKLGLKPYVRPEKVFVRMESQREEAIFLVGGSRPGRMALEPGLTLRKVLPQTDAADWDLQEVELVRSGKRVLRESLGSVFRSQDPLLDAPLLPGDVVSIVPTESLRVWVAGEIARPGQLKMARGATVGQLLAAAGGTTGARDDRDRRVRLRRGPEERTFAYEGGKVLDDVPLEAGDLVSMSSLPQVRVTLAGEVAQQGEYTLEENLALTTALARAGGVSAGGSLRAVTVFRSGEAIRVDASDPATVQTSSLGPLQNGDIVVVAKNERRFFVMGEVVRAGGYKMDEDREYRLADALAVAGGPNDRGVYRRITVVRSGADGRLKPEQYNLDEFLKGGKMVSNPRIEPGDAVYVGSSRGLSLGSVTRVVSGALLLQGLGGGR